ncbi:MAG: SigB/SigF/SigG family RNA polymerase sigma factor [Candidatus Dormibacteria bacterium]
MSLVRPPRDAAELRRTLEQYSRTRDPVLRQRLVEGHEGLVHFLARKFAGRGEPLDDVVQVGFIGLLKALERFDPSLGNEFTTFATPTIVGEIKRYFRDKGWAIRIPRRLQEIYQETVRATEQLRNELMRQPTVSEIARRIGQPEEAVLEALEASPAHTPLSFDAPGGRDGEDGRLAGETVGQDDPNLERIEITDQLERAMTNLTPRERSILYMRFFEELSQSEVAERLGISQMHVSRLQRAALDRLRRDFPGEAGDGVGAGSGPVGPRTSRRRAPAARG